MTLSVSPQAAAQESAPVVATEAPPPEQAAAAPKEEALSPKFAMLARKERDVRRQQQEIAREREALKAKALEYETSYIPKSRISEDTIGVLLESGVSPDQLTEMLLSQQTPDSPAVRQMRAEMKKIQQRQEEIDKRAQDSQKQQYDQALNQIRVDVKALVANDPSYESIKAMAAEDAVVELIKTTFDTDGTLLSIEDASKQVEDYLIEEAVKMASLSKVKAKLAPPPPAPEAAPQKPVGKLEVTPRVPQPMKTLTNAATANQSKPMTNRERRERAIMAFKGQLS